MPDSTYDKGLLRRRLLADRQAVAAEVRRRWDEAICARILAWWNVNPVPTIGVYWPIRDEPDIRATYDELSARGVQLALPMVVARDAPLRFAAWSPGDPLVAAAFGVPVPENTVEVRPEAILLPCVGFNADKLRLGYGGGFYDRTLAAAPCPLAIGIAYCCGMAAFPGEAHDIALDEVITERSPAEFAR